MRDSFNRIHDYLRISLTDNCDLRCFYCMPNENYSFSPPQKLMNALEIENIAKIFIAKGIDKIRLTGGEPFVRKDIAEIIHRLADLNIKLTITTNATQIHNHVELLKSKISGINISLDTLKRQKFFEITKRDLFNRVFDNLHLMLENGLNVKLNVVLIKGVNDDEINDFIQLTQHLPIEVRFIEFMPFDKNEWNSRKVVSLATILETVGSKFEVLALEKIPHSTAKKYKVDGFTGCFAVISTMSAPFCEDCNRLRLTADGKMKNCLFSKSETDLLTAFRNGEDISALMDANLVNKKAALGGQLDVKFENIETQKLQNRSMISIGG